MPEPTGVRWQAPPHTLAKHQILEKYIGAWFSILGQSRIEQRLLFVDGFCGPGEYVQDDGTIRPGSPLIAVEQCIKVLDKGLERMRGKEFLFLFVDDHLERIEWLKERAIPSLGGLPDAIRIRYHHGKFDETLTEILDDIEPGHRLIPAFVMIDPFGWKGFPMELVARILNIEKSEVLITFMLDHVNRFLTHPSRRITEQFEELLGCSAADLQAIIDAPDRFEALSDFYIDRLSEHAWYIRALRMLNKRNHPVYDLTFASNHEYGIREFKRAAWDVDPVSGETFADRTAGQETLFGGDPGPQLRRLLLERFAGKTVTPEELTTFTDHTPFYPGQLKKVTLAPMEEEGLIEYVPSGREKRAHRPGWYPPGSKVRFL